MTKKTHYAMIPKIASIELSPYELALYCNYTQTCGDSGQCTKSNATLAKETKMSVRQVQKMRTSLVKKGYIKVCHNSKFITTCVTILDSVWDKNRSLYIDNQGGAPDAPPMNEVQGGMNEVHPPHAQGAPKEEPNNKNQNNKKKDIVTKRDDEKSESKNTYTPELKNLIAKEIFNWHDPSKVTPKNWKRVMKVLKQIFAVHDCYGTVCTTQHVTRFLRWYRTNKPGWGLPQNEGMETAYQEFYESMRHRDTVSTTLEHILKTNLISEPPEMPEPVQFGRKPHV